MKGVLGRQQTHERPAAWKWRRGIPPAQAMHSFSSKASVEQTSEAPLLILFSNSSWLCFVWGETEEVPGEKPTIFITAQWGLSQIQAQKCLAHSTKAANNKEQVAEMMGEDTLQVGDLGVEGEARLHRKHHCMTRGLAWGLRHQRFQQNLHSGWMQESPCLPTLRESACRFPRSCK